MINITLAPETAIKGVTIVKNWIPTQKEFDYLKFQREIMGFAVKYTTQFYRQDTWDRYLRTAIAELGLEEIKGRRYKTWKV